MAQYTITAEECSSGELSSERIAELAEVLKLDGFLVLENAVSHSTLDILLEKMLADIALLQARPDAPYNWNRGNIQQAPPPFPPYLFREVLVNPFAVAITHHLLGPGVKNSFYSGNTAMPSKERQPVHPDYGQLWPGLAHAHPSAQLIVNIPLVAVTPENGSTEIWPGTHLDTTISLHDDIKVPVQILEARRKLAPPLQPTLPRGSLVIRDIRLWHAGMPNRTDQPRPMIAMIHSVAWLETGNPLKFPRGSEPIFENSPLRTAAEFVDGPIDYIRAPKAYEYTHSSSV